MLSRHLALEFIDRFCRGDIEALAELLAADLVFEGPLLKVDGRENYLAALRSHPPEKSTYKILDCVQEGEKVAIFYEYQKPRSTIKIAQSFVVIKGCIRKILLIFNHQDLA